MNIEQLKAYSMLKFCPACGKLLEVHPNSGWKACFVHGDFIITSTDSDVPIIKWDYLTK